MDGRINRLTDGWLDAMLDGQRLLQRCQDTSYKGLLSWWTETAKKKLIRTLHWAQVVIHNTAREDIGKLEITDGLPDGLTYQIAARQFTASPNLLQMSFLYEYKKKILYSHRTSETSGLAFFFTTNCQKRVTELLSRFIQILERGWSARSSAFVLNNANRCQFFHL